MRLVIIDDHCDLAEVMADFLREEGYRVHTACSGKKGVSLVLRFKPDVVFCDFEMPGIKGDEVVRTLRSQKYKGHIIAYTVGDHSIRMIEAGCNGFISKKALPSELCDYVKKIRQQ